MKFAKIKSERVGTVGFVAPEIIRGHDYCELCDTFSCGVVLLNMITGKMPFPKPKGIGQMVFNPETKLKEFEPSNIYKLFLAQNEKFWSKFGSEISENVQLTSLLNRMLHFDQEKRSTIDQITKHKWYNDLHYKRDGIKTEVESLLKVKLLFSL